ncbi:MAG: hypothetical protein H8E97_06190 [Bacteroidetes bacterium]|nr:hypothetical protein [Bacteroidota bacterium]
MICMLSIYSLLISVTLIVSVHYNYKFGRALIRMEDALEDSIEKLDNRYNSITKILEIPLFSDSPQVRQVVADIKECQRSILFVANEIGRLEESFDGEEENS